MLLTAPGTSAIALVRLTGPLTQSFLKTHFLRDVTEGRCVHGILRADGQVLDDPVIVAFAGGADLNLHGSQWIVESVLRLAQRAGFEIEPFSSERSFSGHFADCQSIIESEVLSALPRARTELALRVLLAQIEAWGSLDARHRAGLVNPIEIERIFSDRSLENLLALPTVALIGAPNVGKSTIANQLFAQQRSITADLPGTTRDWVGEIADVGGLAVMLLDTPGIRQTDDSLEHAAIARGGKQIAQADLVILVLDASCPLEDGQRELLDAYPGSPIVINKSDRPPAWDRTTVQGLSTVGITGVGIDDLRKSIMVHFNCLGIDASLPRAWTERQRQMLRSWDKAVSQV